MNNLSANISIADRMIKLFAIPEGPYYRSGCDGVWAAPDASDLEGSIQDVVQEYGTVLQTNDGKAADVRYMIGAILQLQGIWDKYYATLGGSVFLSNRMSLLGARKHYFRTMAAEDASSSKYQTIIRRFDRKWMKAILSAIHEEKAIMIDVIQANEMFVRSEEAQLQRVENQIWDCNLLRVAEEMVGRIEFSMITFPAFFERAYSDGYVMRFPEAHWPTSRILSGYSDELVIVFTKAFRQAQAFNFSMLWESARFCAIQTGDDSHLDVPAKRAALRCQRLTLERRFVCSEMMARTQRLILGDPMLEQRHQDLYEWKAILDDKMRQRLLNLAGPSYRHFNGDPGSLYDWRGNIRISASRYRENDSEEEEEEEGEDEDGEVVDFWLEGVPASWDQQLAAEALDEIAADNER